MEECQWLPPVIEWLNEETFEAFTEKVYAHYKNYYQVDTFTFQGVQVSCPRLPVFGGFPNLFVHISGNKVGKKRVFDEDRLGHVMWARPIIANYNCAENCCKEKPRHWKKIVDGKVRDIILFRRYLVVLERRPDYYVLVTAYPVNEYRERDLIREYENSR